MEAEEVFHEANDIDDDVFANIYGRQIENPDVMNDGYQRPRPGGVEEKWGCEARQRSTAGTGTVSGETRATMSPIGP